MCGSSFASSLRPSPEPARPRASEASPGLVSSKTNGPVGLVSLGASAVAERRIKRLKRAVWASGHLHQLTELGGVPAVCWFVTLTYIGIDDWRAQHIATAIRRFRKWCKARAIACRYTWVAELQSRGAVHYHLLAWIPRGVEMPHWDLDRGAGTWWPHGMSNTQPAKAGVGYLMKYLSKLGEFHRFPKGLRLYGIGGLTEDGRSVRAWLNLPEWAKLEAGVGELCRRGGRLIVKATGEMVPSPYAVEMIPEGLKLTLTRDLPERFHSGPYSSWPQDAR